MWSGGEAKARIFVAAGADGVRIDGVKQISVTPVLSWGPPEEDPGGSVVRAENQL